MLTACGSSCGPMQDFWREIKRYSFPTTQNPRSCHARTLALQRRALPPPPSHNPFINRIAIRLPSFRLSSSVEKFIAIPRWPPMVSLQPLRRHNGPVLLAPTLVVVSPDALAAGDLRRAEAAFVLRMAGRPTVDCCLRCPRRPFRSPPPSGETRGEPDDGERGGLLLVCLAMLVVATRTSFVVALDPRARDRCTSLARSSPVASSPPAIRFRWKQRDRRGRTMGGGLLLVCR